jgi:enediyne biosynthesis protein E4
MNAPLPQEEISAPTVPTANHPGKKNGLSPRRRRLRWTIAALAGLALLGAALTVYLYLASRPSQYNPAEDLADITRKLERGIPAEAPVPVFFDVTAEAGLGDFRNFLGNRTSQLPEDMGPGVAWGDFNNNGHEDLFVVSAGGALNLPDDQLLPSALYENLGNGQFRKVEAFPEIRIRGMAAAWGDYDGDGYLDLAISGYNALLLLRNEGGTGRFTIDERFPNLPGFWGGISWGDYNNNRRLDLYVCGYVDFEENEAAAAQFSLQSNTMVPFTLNPASYPPIANLLFHNNGDGTFTEKAGELGIANREGRSLAALWHDFDDDGWLDLYVANDVSDNAFYWNRGGRFEEISHAAWVADYRGAMGIAVGDYDRDGDDDMFITHWVAQENALYSSLLADFKRRPADPGADPGRAPRFHLRFMDLNEATGLGHISLPFVGWGTEFVDFDGDGWLDLIVANGSTLEMEGIPKRLRPQEPFLFWNKRGEYFYNIAPLSPVLSQPWVSRGLAVADYDNDGAMDVVLANLGDGVQLLRNGMQKGNWLKLRLRSLSAEGEPVGFADGTRVVAHANGILFRRAISSVSYFSQSSRVLHFGLGEADGVEKLEVHWLGGEMQIFTNLLANTTYELIENDPIPRVFEPQFTQSMADSLDHRTRTLAFWETQRAAMDAFIVDRDPYKAYGLFHRAILLNPTHQDARYYLGQTLVAKGDLHGAMRHMEELTTINPQSHRGFQQWGTLRALAAKTRDDLAASEALLTRAHAINPEETGAYYLMGEVALLLGEFGKAEERFHAVLHANPRAVGAWFLRGYIAWKAGNDSAAVQWLREAREALGPEWHPEGATSEGDVKEKQHTERTPLSHLREKWDGTDEPAQSFQELDRVIARWNK